MDLSLYIFFLTFLPEDLVRQQRCILPVQSSVVVFQHSWIKLCRKTTHTTTKQGLFLVLQQNGGASCFPIMDVCVPWVGNLYDATPSTGCWAKDYPVRFLPCPARVTQGFTQGAVDSHGGPPTCWITQAKVAPLSEEDLILIKKCEGGVCDFWAPGSAGSVGSVSKSAWPQLYQYQANKASDWDHHWPPGLKALGNPHNNWHCRWVN